MSGRYTKCAKCNGSVKVIYEGHVCRECHNTKIISNLPKEDKIRWLQIEAEYHSPKDPLRWLYQ